MWDLVREPAPEKNPEFHVSGRCLVDPGEWMSSLSPSRLSLRHVVAGLFLFLVAAFPFAGPRATATDSFRGTLLAEDETDDVLGDGEVHVYALQLAAGSSTEITAEFRAIDDEDEDDEDRALKRERLGGRLEVTTPDGTPVVQDEGRRPEVVFSPTTDGWFRVRVSSDEPLVEYELQVDVERRGGEYELDVETDGEVVTVPVVAPLGSQVVIDVRRLDGAPPEVLEIRDAANRVIDFDPKRRRRKRLLLRPVPVTSSGGLFVDLTGRDFEAGRYRIEVDVGYDDDDAPDEDDEREARLVVLELRPDADPVDVAERLGFELIRAEDGFAVFETPEGREGFEDEDALSATELLDEVLGGEPEARLSLPDGSQTNGVALGSSLGRIDFDAQRAFAELKVQRAHTRATGRGTRIAVIDTGYDPSHPLLSGRVVPGFDYVDQDNEPVEVLDGVDDDGDGAIDEGYGHGTFVAGLILGVAPDAEVRMIRALDSDGRAKVSWVVAAIYDAVGGGVDVINLSFGMRSRSRLIRAAVEYARAQGVIVVSATGNGGDVNKIDFPGGVPGVIPVTALDENGRRAPFGNAGGRRVIGAPGVDLIGPYPDDRWGVWSGTSFSAALTSGAAALLVELHPDASPERLRRLLVRRAPPLRRRADRKLVRSGSLDLQRLVR